MLDEKQVAKDAKKFFKNMIEHTASRTPNLCPACGWHEIHELYESDRPETFKKKKLIGWVCDKCSYHPFVQESEVNWDLVWEQD